MPTEQHGKVLPLMDAYRFARKHGLNAEVSEVRAMDIDPQLIAKKRWRTVRKGYMVDLLMKQNLWNDFVQECWPAGSTSWGDQKVEHYLLWKSRNEDGGDEEEDDGPEDDVEQQFEFEKQLRDFLKNNLHTIEPGLKLYENAGQNGVEFHVDNGFIDLLSVDKNGGYVVIELKLSKGRNKAVGQLLYYMGWVDANLGHGQCRGMIVAREIPADLVLAVERVSGISFFRYRVSLSVEQVSISKSTP